MRICIRCQLRPTSLRKNAKCCYICRKYHARMLRQERRQARVAPVDTDISAAKIEAMLAAGDAARRRSRWRAA